MFLAHYCFLFLTHAWKKNVRTRLRRRVGLVCLSRRRGFFYVFFCERASTLWSLNWTDFGADSLNYVMWRFVFFFFQINSCLKSETSCNRFEFHETRILHFWILDLRSWLSVGCFLITFLGTRYVFGSKLIIFGSVLNQKVISGHFRAFRVKTVMPGHFQPFSWHFKHPVKVSKSEKLTDLIYRLFYRHRNRVKHV